MFLYQGIPTLILHKIFSFEVPLKTPERARQALYGADLSF